MMRSEPFIYHLVKKQMSGEVLYPLNRLREVLPEVAASYAQKYAGREVLQERTIPPLNCLWNDVLMFSPVHPSHIRQIFQEEGIEFPVVRWFEIPLSRLDAANTAVYQFKRLRPYGDHSDDDTDFTLLSDISFEHLTQTPELLREHIRMAQSDGRRPFPFMGVPHILYKGTLSITNIEIVEF